MYIVLSRHKHHQGYKLTETLRLQRDKHLVNTRQQRESVSLLDVSEVLLLNLSHPSP